MELMLSKEESDGKKRKSCTVDTQTDFGPYSAFPPERDNYYPSAPSSPDYEEQQPSGVENNHEEGHSDNTNNINHQQEITHIRATGTVERQTTLKHGTSDVNRLSKERISRHSEEFELYRTSYKTAMDQNPWDRGETSSKISE